MNNINYIDVTNEWLKQPKKKGKIVNDKYFVDKNIKYKVNNSKKRVWFDFNSQDYIDSLNCAMTLVKTFGGTIFMQPRVDYPLGISTCDFKWNRNGIIEKWDLKIPKGKSKNTLCGLIKNKKRQSDNFIFDLRNHTLTKEDAITQINKEIYNSKHRNWVNKIILIDNKRVLIVIERKMKHIHSARAE